MTISLKKREKEGLVKLRTQSEENRKQEGVTNPETAYIILIQTEQKKNIAFWWETDCNFTQLLHLQVEYNAGGTVARSHWDRFVSSYSHKGEISRLCSTFMGEETGLSKKKVVNM